MKSRIVILLLSFCSTLAYSQTAAYQDADGNSSIFLNNAKANLTYNVSDSKFTVGYLLEQAARSLEYGIHFSGKPSTDVANQFFQSGSSPASIEVGGAFGFNGIVFKGAGAVPKQRHVKADWGVAQVTYTRSTFDTVDTNSATPVTQHFNGVTILPTYNALYNIKGFNFLMGLAAGVNRTNNVDSLKKVKVNTTVGQTGTTTIVQQNDAYLGTYSTGIGAPVYSDFVFIPKKLNWLGIDGFERANVTSTNRYAEGGVGVFISKPESPTDVLGGISIGWKNGDRTIALVAGWSF